jgi:hypothetical protein
MTVMETPRARDARPIPGGHKKRKRAQDAPGAGPASGIPAGGDGWGGAAHGARAFSADYDPPGAAKALGHARAQTAAELSRAIVHKGVEAWERVLDDPKAPHMALVAAGQALVERAEGKPVQRVINTVVRAPLPLDLDKLTPLQLEVLEELLLMMRAPRTADAPQIEGTAEVRDEV